jgi:hypothetical protein
VSEPNSKSIPPGHALFDELKGATCRCGRVKKEMQTFCGQCYRKLPEVAQRNLYKRIGQGYEQAYAAAVEILEPAPRSIPSAASIAANTPTLFDAGQLSCTCGRGDVDLDPNCPMHGANRRQSR